MHQRGRHPPHLQQSVWRQTAQFVRDPVAFVAACAHAAGPVFVSRIVGEVDWVWIGDPALARAIFSLKIDEFEGYNNVPLNLGDTALLYISGEQHQACRRLLRPPLHGDRIATYGEAMRRHTDQAIDVLPIATPFAMADVLQQVTLAVILECVFGVTAARLKQLETLVQKWANAVMSPWSFALNVLLDGKRVRRWFDSLAAKSPVHRGKRGRTWLRPWHHIADAKAGLDRCLEEEIERCRKEGTTGRKDVVALLVDSCFEDGAPMSNEMIRHQLLTMLIGGHETTATTLAWAVHHIFSQPALLAALLDEQEQVFGALPLDLSKIDTLVLLPAVLKESMRLMPISLGVVRKLNRPISTDSYQLDAGTVVCVSPYLLHHNPAIWQEPQRFDPQRFVQQPNRPVYEYTPFGGGKRMCIGQAFAYYEMKIIMSQLLRRVTLQLATTERKAMMKGLTLAPHDGVLCTVSERKAGL